MEVGEELARVNAVLVDLGEVAEHEVAEGDEFFEGLVFAVGAAYFLVDAVEFEEEELVGHDFKSAELRDEVVDGGHLRQEGGMAEAFVLLLEVAHGAAVVHHHQHAVGVLGVVGGDAVCYLSEERVHCFAFSRVSGLPTSSQCSAGWMKAPMGWPSWLRRMYSSMTG